MIDDGRIEGAYPELVELVSDVQLKMAEATEALCVQKMIDLNIEPDVVQLQALEIQRLRGLLQEREWVSVLERLPKPDKNRKYLVCGKNGGIYIAEFVCRTVSSGTPIGPWWHAHGRYCPEPIAWMPLPEAYKGE